MPLHKDIEKYLKDPESVLPLQKLKEMREDYFAKSEAPHPVLKKWKLNQIDKEAEDMDTDYASNPDFDCMLLFLFLLLCY